MGCSPMDRFRFNMRPPRRQTRSTEFQRRKLATISSSNSNRNNSNHSWLGTISISMCKALGSSSRMHRPPDSAHSAIRCQRYSHSRSNESRNKKRNQRTDAAAHSVRFIHERFASNRILSSAGIGKKFFFSVSFRFEYVKK